MSAEPIHTSNYAIIGGNSGVSGNMASNVTSLVVNMDSIISYSIQALFTGVPVGTIQIAVSNDAPLNNIPTNFTPVPESLVAISAAGSYTLNVEKPSYSWVRIQYIATSGSGTLSARINTKRR